VLGSVAQVVMGSSGANVEIMTELNEAGQAKVFAPTPPPIISGTAVPLSSSRRRRSRLRAGCVTGDCSSTQPASNDTKSAVAAALGFVAQQTAVPAVGEQTTAVPAVGEQTKAVPAVDPAFDELLERQASELNQAIQQLTGTAVGCPPHAAAAGEQLSPVSRVLLALTAADPDARSCPEAMPVFRLA
jgi:hypothetical protein